MGGCVDRVDISIIIIDTHCLMYEGSSMMKGYCKMFPIYPIPDLLRAATISLEPAGITPLGSEYAC